MISPLQPLLPDDLDAVLVPVLDAGHGNRRDDGDDAGRERARLHQVFQAEDTAIASHATTSAGTTRTQPVFSSLTVSDFMAKFPSSGASKLIFLHAPSPAHSV